MPSWVNSALSAAIATIVAALAASIRHVWSRQKVQVTQQEAVKDGMLALIHDRIFTTYGECIEKGYAPVEVIRNVDYLYQPYHSLGGNGTGTELYERIKKMPTEPPA